MFNNNVDVLNIIYKISDDLEFEVDQDNIVTILEKQDHKFQKFFRKLKLRIPEYKRTVREIGENLEVKFGDKVHPLYERLLMFLNHIDVNCHYIKKVNF
jgi:hypothetical protein